MILIFRTGNLSNYAADRDGIEANVLQILMDIENELMERMRVYLF